MQAMDHYDVAIVGYGPTGATLAHLLGECGLRVVVLDREGAAYHLPRAVHFDGEVMRVFQWAGIAAEMEPKTARHFGARFIDSAGKLLMEWKRPQGTGPQGWRAAYLFHQPDLETLLRDHLARRANVDVKTHHDVFLVRDRGSDVELRYEDVTRGKIGHLTATYVVGCDGARSLVRRLIGSGLKDYGFHERWLVLDVVLNQPKPDLGDYTIQYCVPERPATYVRGPGLRRRWEMRLDPAEASADMAAPERVWELLAPWLRPDEATLERSAVYTFHSTVAETWCEGRLLIAGDAAHQTPPFMGQGMCAGVRDAANLYWKLALICRGSVTGLDADQLLDTYESERRPNVAEYVRTAIRLGGLINNSGTEAALSAAFPVGDGARRMASIAPPLGPGLGRGKSAGRVFGQPRLADGRPMDDVYPHRFVVVAEEGLADGLALPAGSALVTTADSPDAAEHLSRAGTRAVVLRPDRYTLGNAGSREELAELIDHILPSPIAALQAADA